MIYSDFIQTPLGSMEITATSKGISETRFVDKTDNKMCSNATVEICKMQLAEYFAKKRKHFDIPLDLHGTYFQKQVWHCLLQIPFANTTSYSDIATRVGKPKAVRAVGAANGKNPVAIIVPCHRIIGKKGTLTGYAGGIERKAWLLAHEQTVVF